jgi:uncharacterized membrane protein
VDAGFQVAELRPSRGASWLAEAFNLFRVKPFAWIGLCTAWLLITLVLVQLGPIGAAVANFIQPAFFASFAIAAFRQAAGEPVLMGDLFSGFRRNLRALVMLGAILVMLELSVLVLMWVMLGMPQMSPDDTPERIGEYLESLKGREWILLLGFLLSAFLKGALWFAPPLIAFHDMQASQAMRWSVYAAISNIGAMVVYGLSLVVAMIVAVIPWGLGLLVVIPVMAISTFIGYREVFAAKT